MARARDREPGLLTFPGMIRLSARPSSGWVSLYLLLGLAVSLLLAGQGRAVPPRADGPPSTTPVPHSPTPTAVASTTPAVTDFGMTMHFMWYETARALGELDQLQAAGLKVIRFDVGWRWIEPQQKGTYDPSTLAKLDTILSAMDTRGITPIVTVIETPAWARPTGTDIFTPPTRRQDYADMIGMLAARYAHRPNMTWEVWNEPNLVEFWATGPNPAEYADLLIRAATAIKAADPDATVLGGSIAFNDLTFLRGMYDAGARGSFDGLALHPYAPGRSPDNRQNPLLTFGAIEAMAAEMTANGDPDKPIWITEMGWGLDLVTDETRAAYLRRAVELVRSWPYVRAFCVYTLSRDIGPDAPRFGLLAPAGVPSPSWAAYIASAASAGPSPSPSAGASPMASSPTSPMPGPTSLPSPLPSLSPSSPAR